jgi:hypothetical protein
MPQPGYTLSSLVENANHLRQLPKSSLQPGTWVFVKTANSVYTVHILQDGFCKVSGGWFDRKGLSPATTRISGCTWGGSTIKIDIAAACGLCMEFGNRLVTTPIKKIVVLPGGCEN